SNEDAQQATVRHSVIDQLTFDPSFGVTGQLPADGAILLAWGSHSVLDIEVEHQQARQVGNVLYYIPVGLKIEGQAAFTPDLVQSTVVQVDATQFSRDPFNFNIAGGSIT